ncbi:MAG TPA: hypothetical protein VI248_19315 [Kineosporiaceae bacterium]
MLAVLDGEEFVDAAPATVYAALLDQGVHVRSISRMYRILREHAQLVERRRQARHPARTRPELSPPPWAGPELGHHQAEGPVKGYYYDAYLMISLCSQSEATHRTAEGQPAGRRQRDRPRSLTGKLPLVSEMPRVRCVVCV